MDNKQCLLEKIALDSDLIQVSPEDVLPSRRRRDDHVLLLHFEDDQRSLPNTDSRVPSQRRLVFDVTGEVACFDVHFSARQQPRAAPLAEQPDQEGFDGQTADDEEDLVQLHRCLPRTFVRLQHKGFQFCTNFSILCF